MPRPLYFALIMLAIMLTSGQIAGAVDMPLTWDASPSPDVSGYKIYYKSDSMTLPLNGTGATEGPSPIDVGKDTTSEITDLPDGQVHYFAVTAYDSAGYESAYSNVIASSWIPVLTAPSDGSVAESSTDVTFTWETAPSPYEVTYTLYYGTEPQLTALTVPHRQESSKLPLQSILFYSLLGILGTLLANREKNKPARAFGAMALVLGLLLAGCGSGGSSGGSVIPNPDTMIVETGSDDYHFALDLEPATTYYWKVVANDQTDPGIKYQSLTYSFTTLSN